MVGALLQQLGQLQGDGLRGRRVVLEEGQLLLQLLLFLYHCTVYYARELRVHPLYVRVHVLVHLVQVLAL